MTHLLTCTDCVVQYDQTAYRFTDAPREDLGLAGNSSSSSTLQPRRFEQVRAWEGWGWLLLPLQFRTPPHS